MDRSTPPLRTADAAILGWAAITVRVAWTLMRLGVKVRPETLRNVREHVLFHVEPGWSVPVSEDRAEFLVMRFVYRARRGGVDDLAADYGIDVDPRWHRVVHHSLDPLSRLLLHHHFADGRDLREMERRFRIDRITLEAAREGLREVLRRAAGLSSWAPERVDRMLCRVASWAPPSCPPIQDVLDGHHYDHAHHCPRCSRARRMVHAGIIEPEDLVPPTGEVRATGQAQVLALHFHPDARHHRDAIERELPVTQRMGDDLLLVKTDDSQAVHAVLLMAAEVGAPGRDHLRGASVQGPGRWSAHGLLGPLAVRARGAVRSRPWGRIDGLGELPNVLPPPPSAAAIWGLVGVLGLVALLLVRPAAVSMFADDVDHPIAAEFTSTVDGLWADFDVSDDALMTVIAATQDGLDVVLRSLHPADKAAMAVGDGRFRFQASGEGLLLVSSGAPLEQLDEWMSHASEAPSALDDLARTIGQNVPRADIRVRRR